MFWFSLPPQDAAYHAAPFAFLSDPFVLTGALVMALLIGLGSFPFVYFAVRGFRLRTTAAFIFGSVLAEIVIFTPFDRRFGMAGAVAALALALCLVRFSGWRVF